VTTHALLSGPDPARGILLSVPTLWEQDARRQRWDARPNTKAGLRLVVLRRAELRCFTP